MTFVLSYHPNVPALLAQPRLFLGPEIPGYVSAGGRVMLPMTLNGRMTDTGLHRTDLKGLEGFLSRHEDRFVCASPKFTIYKHREKYEAAVRPNWLKDVVDWIDEDVERYESVLDSHPFQRTALQVVKGQMKSLLPIFSACIYLGECNGGEAIHFLLSPRFSPCTAPPVGLKEGNLYPVLSLLETIYGAHERLRMGMAEKLVVRRGTGPSEHDIPGFSDLHGSFVEFALREGALPVLAARAGEAGRGGGSGRQRQRLSLRDGRGGDSSGLSEDRRRNPSTGLRLFWDSSADPLRHRRPLDGGFDTDPGRGLEEQTSAPPRSISSSSWIPKCTRWATSCPATNQGFEGLCLLRALQSVTSDLLVAKKLGKPFPSTREDCLKIGLISGTYDVMRHGNFRFPRSPGSPFNKDFNVSVRQA
jgi:hypothetical protein